MNAREWEEAQSIRQSIKVQAVLLRALTDGAATVPGTISPRIVAIALGELLVKMLIELIEHDRSELNGAVDRFSQLQQELLARIDVRPKTNAH